MSTTTDLDSLISYFFVRSGSSSAVRKDLDGNVSTEEQESNIDLDIKLQPSAQTIRITINLSLEDAYAQYRTIVLGEWTSENEDAFRTAIAENEPALEEMIMTILAPQVLSVAQAKILDLARSIDCPASVFPYSLIQDIRAARPKSNSKDEVNGSR